MKIEQNWNEICKITKWALFEICDLIILSYTLPFITKHHQQTWSESLVPSMWLFLHKTLVRFWLKIHVFISYIQPYIISLVANLILNPYIVTVYWWINLSKLIIFKKEGSISYCFHRKIAGQQFFKSESSEIS